jgi:hypothetical protein
LQENEFHTAELLAGLHSYGIKINLTCDKSFSKPNALLKDPHTIFSRAHEFDSYTCSAFKNGQHTLAKKPVVTTQLLNIRPHQIKGAIFNKNISSPKTFFEPKFTIISGSIKNDQRLKVIAAYREDDLVTFFPLTNQIFTISDEYKILKEQKKYGLVPVNNYQDINTRDIMEFTAPVIKDRDNGTIFTVKLNNVSENSLQNIIGHKFQLIKIGQSGPYKTGDILFAGTMIFSSLYTGKFGFNNFKQGKGSLSAPSRGQQNFKGIYSQKMTEISCYYTGTP